MDGPFTPNEAGLSEALLRHRDWARRLAASIVTDGGSAEDAVQDAWVAALLHPPRHAGNLRSWFSFLVRNAVRQTLRAGSRRRRREHQVARPERLPAASDAIERAELHQRLFEAVLGLPESCRRVVLLAYFDDLAPNEIARQLGMPASTVRSHLRRGLQRLREDLEKKNSGKDGGLLSSLAALAWPRARIAPAASGTAGGGILVATQTKLILAGTVIALLGGWAWWSHEFRTSHLQVSEHRESDTSLVEELHITPQAPQTIPESRREEPGVGAVAPSQAIGEAALGELVVTVQWESDGSRAGGVGVQVRRPGDLQGLERVEGETNSDGVLRLTGVRPGGVWVAADRSDETEASIRPGEKTEVALKISTEVDVRGRVVDPEQRPVPGAGIWISWAQPVHGTGRIATIADAKGQFFVRGLRQFQKIGARLSGRAPSSLRTVDRTSGVIETVFVLPGPGGAVEGRVLDLGGAPIATARVEVSQLNPNRIRFEDTSFAPGAPAPGCGITGNNGEFRITDVGAGTCEVVVRAKGHAWSKTTIDVPEGGTAHAEVTLHRGATLSGRVLDGKGVPLASIPLWIISPPVKSRLSLGGQRNEYVGSSGESGQFKIEGLPVGHTEFLAEREDTGRASTSLDLAEGVETTWDAVLSRGLEISGRVVDKEGRGLARWFVTAKFAKTHFRDEEIKLLSWRGSCRSQADGAFSIPNCLADVPLRIAVSSPEALGQELAWVDEVKAGSEGIEIQVGGDAQPSAFLVGMVLDPGGRPVGDAEVSARRVMGASASQADRTNSVTGKFRIGPLPPGIYRVQVIASGQTRLETPPNALSEKQELDLGALRFPESGTVVVRLQPKAGASSGDLDLSVYGDSHTPIDLLEITTNVARSSRLPVGSYRLVVREDNRATQQIPFDISTDHETELSVELSVIPR